VASIVNPPGNKRANFRTAEHNPPSAQAWLAESESVEGSWWPDFSTWLHARTGEQVPTPTPRPDELNGAANLGPAPGTYVHIR
jgi:polyhydroxyalkanoate synthase